jgi:hypothetical protein
MSIRVDPIPAEDKTFVRLLVCHDCRSIDQVPDYSGPAEHDYYLKYRCDQHNTNGHPHRGILIKVEDRDAVIDATIDEVEEAVRQHMPGTGEGLGQVMYDLRDNYMAEAMSCWKQHNRTTNCDEYRSDRKRLWIDTKAERKEEGLSTNKRDRPNIWLCDHCPVHSEVTKRKRKAAGQYDS